MTDQLINLIKKSMHVARDVLQTYPHLVLLAACHLADTWGSLGIVIDGASTHANFNGTDNGDGVVVVVDSSRN